MGAGCYYTLEEDRDVRAYWLDVGYPDEDDFENWNYEENLKVLGERILELPICGQYGYFETYKGGGEYARDYTKIYYGESYIVSLESNHEGDGIVINFTYQNGHEDNGLVLYNYSRSYHKLIRHINKQFPLRIATSGYTSCEIPVGEVSC